MFLAAHLLNTAVGALGPAAYDGTQRALRTAYQAPVVELVAVLGALGLHLVLGVWTVVRRGSRAFVLPASRMQRAHRVSGWLLATVAIGHVSATRGSAWLVGAAPGFAGLAWTFEWLPAFFVPYYVALGIAGVVHGVVGILVASGRLGLAPGASTGRALRAGAWVLGVCVLLGVAGLGGVFGASVETEGSAYARWIRAVVQDPLGVTTRAWQVRTFPFPER